MSYPAWYSEFLALNHSLHSEHRSSHLLSLMAISAAEINDKLERKRDQMLPGIPIQVRSVLMLAASGPWAEIKDSSKYAA